MIEEIGYGKINLALAITGRRDDGYHTIDTIFQSIGLHDVIQIEESDAWQLTCSDARLACDETNLAYKAYMALTPYSQGRSARIHIEKHIPIAAGLAGGSTDCAAVLRGLNRLWSLALTEAELCRIGATLGADVPFCIVNGTKRGKGIGDLLSPLPPLPSWEVLILHPKVPVYTKKAYSLYDSKETVQPIPVEQAAEAIRQGDFEGLMQHMENTFEELVIPDVPIIATCKELLCRLGLQSLMAGSGPTVFSLVPSRQNGQELYEALQKEVARRPIEVYITKLVRGE